MKSERNRVVTVAIVTYKSKPELPDCISSLLKSDVALRIVIIDNASNDGTLELARSIAAQHDNIIVVDSGKNVGLAAGNNLVMPHICGDFVLLLNPDTVVHPDTISGMLTVMEQNQRVGIVGPLNVYGDGSRCSSYQKFWNLWHVFVWRVLPYSLPRRIYDKWSLYKEGEVLWVSGSCLLVRSEIFKSIGGYDPEFFLTIEDVCDLCRRVKKLGYKIIFSPRSEVVHFGGRSGGQVPVLSLLANFNGSVYYFRKYNGRLGASLAFGIIVGGCSVMLLLKALKRGILRRDADVRGLQIYLQALRKFIHEGSRLALSSLPHDAK